MEVHYKKTLVTCLTLACTCLYAGVAHAAMPTQVTIPGVSLATVRGETDSDPALKKFVQRTQSQLKMLGMGSALKEVEGDLNRLSPLLQSSTVVILKEGDADIRFRYPYASVMMFKNASKYNTASYATATVGGVLMTEVRDMELPKDKEWDGKTVYYDEFLPYENASDQDLSAAIVAKMNRLEPRGYTAQDVQIGKFSWPNFVGATWDITPYGDNGYQMPTINFSFENAPKATYHIGGYLWNMSHIGSLAADLFLHRHSLTSEAVRERLVDKTGKEGLTLLGEEILPTIQQASSIEKYARLEQLGGLHYYVPLSFTLQNDVKKDKKVYVDRDKKIVVAMKKLKVRTNKSSNATDEAMLALRRQDVAKEWNEALQVKGEEPFYMASVWNGQWPSFYTETMLKDEAGAGTREMSTTTFDDAYRYTITLSVPEKDTQDLQMLRNVVQTVVTDTHREELEGMSPIGVMAMTAKKK